MRITVLANQDLASNYALNHLLPALAPKHDISVFLSSRVGKAAAAPPDLEQLRFFEQSLFNDILFPALDQAGTRGELLTFSGLAAYTAQAPAILNGINSEEGLSTLRSTHPELILSIRYGGILREDAIAVPEYGVINLHSGLLPAYRGVMASFRALLAGEPELGCTLHTITDPSIDTGDIIATTNQPVVEGASYLLQVLNLYPTACERLAECVQTIESGGALALSQQPSGGQYFSFPTEVDLQQFRERGLTLYDGEEITAFCRKYSN